MNEPDDTRSASGVTESGPADKRDGFSPYSPPDEASEKESKRSLRRPTRRTWTIIFSIALVVTFVLVGSYVRVPYVALGPGPTYDTLGENEGRDVVTIDGARSYDDDGQLRMTTVSLNDEVTLFGALGLWISGRYSVAPREEYFQPGQTDEQVRQENVEQFQQSQSQAEVAALRALGHPVRVVADQIVDDTPAAELLEPGDELNEVNGRSVSEQSEVMAALENTRPGQDVEITYTRGDAEPRTVTATLTQHPQGQNHGFLGVQPADRADVPFTVDISLEHVGGPSAGMMFALAIVDRLDEEKLLDGRTVAGTGEINSRGEVGAIGGISFKVVAAKEDGAEAFLVPADNCAEAAAAAPEGLKLLRIETLDDAVDGLRALRDGREAPTCQG